MAQSRKELEKKRTQILTEIKENNRLLEKTKKDQKTELQRFQMLQTQVQQREELLKTLKSEVRALDRQVQANRKETDKLESEIASLMDEYGKVLKRSYKLRLASDPLLMILSARDLNQAFQRWLYINQIKKMRTAQATLIRNKTQDLKEKIRQLENFKAEKTALLRAEEDQTGKLAGELQEKDRLLANLKKDESRLRKIIDQKRLDQEKLDTEVKRLIAIEIEKQRKEEEARRIAAEKARKEKEEKERRLAAQREKEAAETDASASSSSAPVAVTTTPAKKEKTAQPRKVSHVEEIAATPESNSLSNDFVKNKGNLPWPVAKGVVQRKYGVHQHAVVSSVVVNNTGVDIRTERDAPVRSVFHGTVIGKSLVPPFNYMVIIKHGAFFTAYANLKDIRVKEGQKVTPGEIIGLGASEEDEPFSIINFQIWKGDASQDPAAWLKR